MKNLVVILVWAVCIFSVGCAPNISPNTYVGAEVGVVSRVQKGVVISKREVNIDNAGGAGGVAGTAAGAAAGSTIGHGIAPNVAGAVGAAVVGGVIGHALDKNVNRHRGMEYIIRLGNGDTISVVQTTETLFHEGQHVLIIYGAVTRIIADSSAKK